MVLAYFIGIFFKNDPIIFISVPEGRGGGAISRSFLGGVQEKEMDMTTGDVPGPILCNDWCLPKNRRGREMESSVESITCTNP